MDPRKALGLAAAEPLRSMIGSAWLLVRRLVRSAAGGVAQWSTLAQHLTAQLPPYLPQCDLVIGMYEAVQADDVEVIRMLDSLFADDLVDEFNDTRLRIVRSDILRLLALARRCALKQRRPPPLTSMPDCRR